MIIYLSEHIDADAVAHLKAKATLVDNLDEIEKIDAMVVRNMQVTEEMLSKAKNLKIVARNGIGVDNIDLAAAKKYGIIVTNTPASNSDSVAELIVGLFIASQRKFYAANKGVRENRFATTAPAELKGNRVGKKVLGQIGMGNVAQKVAKILKNGFDCRAVAYDPFVSAEKAKEMGFEKVETVEEVLDVADMVNISVPLTASTKNLISGKMFDHFKKDAVLVDAARGGIVNEDDLYNALVSGKLKAAACDVFITEPPSTETAAKLLSLENFSATPHIGGDTEEALRAAGQMVVTDIFNVLEGRAPLHRVC